MGFYNSSFYASQVLRPPTKLVTDIEIICRLAK